MADLGPDGEVSFGLGYLRSFTDDTRFGNRAPTLSGSRSVTHNWAAVQGIRTEEEQLRVAARFTSTPTGRRSSSASTRDDHSATINGSSIRDLSTACGRFMAASR